MEQGEAVRRREAEKRKNEARRRRQKKRKRQQMFARSVMVLTGTVFVGVILYGGWRLSHRTAQAQEEIVAEETKYIADRPDFSVELLDYNEYSRPGTALEKVNGIVVHYTANPGTTAQQNRIILKDWHNPGRHMQAAILSSESAEKSSSVFHAMRLHMLQTTETAIRFP